MMPKNAVVDKIVELPHDINAEQATLGAALFSLTARDELIDYLTPDDFYEEAHKELFKAISDFKDYNSESTAIDRVTFGNFLRREGALEKCGGIAYIESLSESSPVPSNAMSYAKIVKENSLRRKVIMAADNARLHSLSPTDDIEDTIEEGVSTFTDLQTYGTSTDEFYNVSNIARQLQNKIEAMNDLGVNTGIKTGFQYLDNKIGGFKESQYVIVAARPSCGKTAFALSCISNILNMPMDIIKKDENGKYFKTQKDIKVGFFSLEMPCEDILKRIFSMRSLVPYSLIAQNKLGTNKDDKNRVDLFNAVKQFYSVSSRLFVYDSSNMSIQNIKAAARKLKRQEDVDILFIDYFSRIDAQASIKNTRMQGFEMWGYISRQLKSLSADLKIPIVCLAQLNREAEKTKPTLANLRDTGAIEQDADIVIMLHNPERNEENQESQDEMRPRRWQYNEPQFPGSVDVQKVTRIQTIISKHRNGETGSSELCLLGDFVRFVEPESITEVS